MVQIKFIIFVHVVFKNRFSFLVVVDTDLQQ